MGIWDNDPYDPSWIKTENFTNRTTIYINAVLYIVYTMTTVGYGNITPSDEVSIAFAFILMVKDILYAEKKIKFVVCWCALFCYDTE